MKQDSIIRPLHGGEPDLGFTSNARTLLDFSVNLNFVAADIPDQTWLEWKQFIREYPPSSSRQIEGRFAKCLRVDAQNIFVTSGGNEALSAALGLEKDRTIVIPTPCFSEYPHLAEQRGCQIKRIPLTEEQSYSPNIYLDFPTPPNSTVILANPNNPTGVSIPVDLLVSKIKESSANNINWIIDEAFIEFTPKAWKNSLMYNLKDLPNLMVAGSLTKTWNIPGLRIGFLATSNQEKISKLRQTQLTWPLNGLAHAWAQTYLEPARFLTMVDSLSVFKEWRDRFQIRLRKTPLLTPLSSDCNFFLCCVNTELIQPLDLYRELLKRSIHVRRCDTIPGLENKPYLRFAVRPPNDTKLLLEALVDIECRLETLPARHPSHV